MQARKSGMSKRGRTLAALVWAASVLAGLVQFAPESAATEATDPAQTVALAVSRTEAKQAARFWTRENRLTATDYVATMPTVDDEGSVQAPPAPEGRPGIGSDTVGPAVSSPLADGVLKARPRSVEPGNLAPTTVASSIETQRAPRATYYSYEWNGATNQVPAMAMGRLFFQVPGEPSTWQHFCSATVVASEGKNLLFTAGHCVYTPYGTDRDYPSAYGQHYNVSFCPGYRGGSCPLGIWSVEQMNTTTGWMNSASYRYDMAAIRMQPINGWEIASWVGSIGITWNQPYSTRTAWYAFGYPYAAWNGYGPSFPAGVYQNLWICISYERRYGTPPTDLGATDTGPSTIGIDCNMTGGASGGGWLRGSTAGLLNGVNSYKPIVGGQEMMYSPYFGVATQNLFTAVRYG